MGKQRRKAEIPAPRSSRPTEKSSDPKKGRVPAIHVGLAVAPGVAIGRAYCIPDIFETTACDALDDAAVMAELALYDRARDIAAAELRQLRDKVRQQVGPRAGAIFQAHESILRDPAFSDKVRGWMADLRLSAQAALQRLFAEYTALFTRATDEYLKDRLSDVRDVIVRLGHILQEDREPYADAPPGPLILVANELVPSHVVTLGKREVCGIVTQAGGRTSHAAILARGRGIPAVSGVAGILHKVANGDTLVVDGREGRVLVNPDGETQRAYRKLQREFVDLKDELAGNYDQPAVTADGAPLELLGNISNLADARATAAMGGAGVGLFRTEYLFLGHADVPAEDEQVAIYRDVIAASPQRRVTIRTLDIGGDKKIPYLGLSGEANPFMGWRSIRISFEHPAFFVTQIRAVLRAAAFDGGPRKQVRLMFPMITTLDELRKVRKMVHKACRQLAADGLPCGEVPVGLMLEVPAAAVSLDSLLEVSDFVSIGSNDLVQYLMAADRDNPKVSHLCEPLSPAVLRVLHQAIGVCRDARKPVTLCGEMASSPRAFVLLVGMGLRSFSMSPAFIPLIKELASHLTVATAESILQDALAMETTAQIIRFLSRRLAEICPSIAALESA